MKNDKNAERTTRGIKHWGLVVTWTNLPRIKFCNGRQGLRPQSLTTNEYTGNDIKKAKSDFRISGQEI